VTYRVAVRASVALGITLVAIAAAGSASGADRATARLRLDGVPIRPEIALTSAQRALGLMHRTKAPADGMLFVFPSRSMGGFWMKNTLVPLKIVFFDVAGKRVRTMRMTPCPKDPCTVYDPGKPYRFALELPATDTRPATRLGPLASLRALTGRAS
jgi:uncharacterized membrane protein (UPF0127 family)